MSETSFRVVFILQIFMLFSNYDFISKCLLEQRDEKGNVNLYSFLKKIWDGINLSLGGVNQIEPVIK